MGRRKMTCDANQWSVDSFRLAVTAGVEFEGWTDLAVGIPLESMDRNELKARIIERWLRYAVPAGTA